MSMLNQIVLACLLKVYSIATTSYVLAYSSYMEVAWYTKCHTQYVNVWVLECPL